MTVKEIVALENKNPNSVLLHAEGMFYRLYNKSAFWWHDTVKPFKLSTKFVKTISAPLVSIGFTVSKWDAYKKLLLSKGISGFTEIQASILGFETQALLNEEPASSSSPQPFEAQRYDALIWGERKTF